MIFFLYQLPNKIVSKLTKCVKWFMMVCSDYTYDTYYEASLYKLYAQAKKKSNVQSPIGHILDSNRANQPLWVIKEKK